jgi:TRAP-type C4-dicarboxylate transport system substrate-binding protein
MAFSPWVMFNSLDPRLGALELPFLFASDDAARYGINAAVPLYDQLLQKKFNAKGLGAVYTGSIELFSTGKPVKTLEDWKGLLTATLSPALAMLVKDLGGSPVTIMWTDMYEALQKKVVNAATQAGHGAVIMSFTDVCKYGTYSRSVSGMNAHSINLDVWKKMPPRIQKILLEEVASANDWFTKAMRKVDVDDLKVLKEKGVQVYFLPPAERARWEKAAAPSSDNQLAAFGDFGAKIKKIADDANKKYPYKAK